ncbi:DUF4129 domain-containing protein [Ruegeria sp. EL01]|jgi:hypothetical protein|uniref:DUF4129 domain-containing protein n=1 Tax=Ruegeria sp. EL01 TaxID=2107578 RepID=UPI000EA832D3|nr:DUF4129 domain-containing protein [Ruegeria sp. EL01]
MKFLWVPIFSCFLCAFSPANAQEAALSRTDISASGQEYLKAVRYRGIDTDVVYFDPTRPAPPLDTRFTPETERRQSVTLDNRWVVGGVSAIVLIFLALFVYFGASGTSVAFGSISENARRRGGREPTDERPDSEEIPDLEAILRLQNRDQAVAGLAQLALGNCLTANEVLFKRSWTHREALRSLPQNLWYIADLRALVLESERVNFGHRSISEVDFRNLLNRVRPILSEVRA